MLGAETIRQHNPFLSSSCFIPNFIGTMVIQRHLFLICGDVFLILSQLVLLLAVFTPKSSTEISPKTPILYAIVFTTRYLDLFFFEPISTYNSIVKIFLLSSSYFMVYFLRCRRKVVFLIGMDNFRIQFLLLPVVIVTILKNHRVLTECFLDSAIMDKSWQYWFLEFGLFQNVIIPVFHDFSCCLEAVASLPLMWLSFRGRTGSLRWPSFVDPYLFLIGFYRAFYILFWIYRFFMIGVLDAMQFLCVILQIGIYVAFRFSFIFEPQPKKQSDKSM